MASTVTVPLGPATRIVGVPWNPSFVASLLTVAMALVAAALARSLSKRAMSRPTALASERATAGVNHSMFSSPWFR